MSAINKTRILTTALAVLMAASAAHAEAETTGDKGKVLYYRAPMSSDTSSVPKKDSMGMDYVPVYADEAKEEPGTVRLTAERIQQLGVRTAIVERRDLARTVHAVGTVQIDETRQTLVSPRFDGWIEKLYADATGMQVKKGDPLFVFYSPELTHIEAEYPFSHALNGPHAMNGTIERLESLAVPPEEIARLQKEHTANYHMTLTAPADGTVIKKTAIEGMQFAPGTVLYSLVDLSNVWVIADVYEQDLAGIDVGQTAKITFTAFPGHSFEGKVGFVYPDINKETRTAKVRIDLPNPAGELRLDMYADVNIAGTPEKNVLTIPVSAVLNSGERKVVLIDLGDGRFRPQAVKTGMRAGDSVEILDGLKEGDRVVTTANFLIDSESNLRAALQSFTPPENKP
ncbi:MAG: efflux RND transporter periplasmic adaptor subunit [Alphaproteobacteria bacterium]|nr:efflux RND transporter periplasmic adaptor subunit [Alphaproteobacteria bacterium]